MIQYHPVNGASPAPRSDFFKEVGYAVKPNKARVSFAVHTTTGKCQSVGPLGVVVYTNIDEMRDAARVLRDKGWQLGRR